MEPRLSFVTLGVADLERSTRFYRDVLPVEARGCTLRACAARACPTVQP
jgi:catechol-2,3-dioxygenase